jgi:hypothetical protein
MDMATSKQPLITASRKKHLSCLSLLAWGFIGLAVGLVIGGLAVEVAAGLGEAGKTVNVRVEVFGIKVRQGKGPESFHRVVWSWGVGLIALFGFLGASVGIAGRLAVSILLTAAGTPGTKSKANQQTGSCTGIQDIKHKS